MWFRYDLRVSDNEALTKAMEYNECYPIYIVDTSQRELGGASQVWLNHALKDLNKSLSNSLSLFIGQPDQIISNLVKNHSINSVYFDHTYDPAIEQSDQNVIQALNQLDCNIITTNQRTLWDIRHLFKYDQEIYTVFSPFFRKGCLKDSEPAKPKQLNITKNIEKFSESNSIDNIIPIPNHQWTKSITNHWPISESGAQKVWKTFRENGLIGYKQKRNFPSKKNVSRLSPYIHFGQISIRQLYHETILHGQGKDRDHFISELGWREFAYYLLYHSPNLSTKNFQQQFDHFPWEFNEMNYKAWCHGNTGYPIVDAGMRELYQTGYMHNRLRMICGSFLVKNLRYHWKHGEKWFWDCLFDADQATNAASWQWVAGTGTDAATYFRIFNPTLQGKKFDPTGSYIRKYIPELAELPNEFLNEPWAAPKEILDDANVTLGSNYPNRIINFEKSRDESLEAFEKIKRFEGVRE